MVAITPTSTQKQRPKPVEAKFPPHVELILSAIETGEFARRERREAVHVDLTAPPPLPRAVSHWRRNSLLVGVGVAVVAGSVAIFAGIRGSECGRGCIDLRH